VIWGVGQADTLQPIVMQFSFSPYSMTCRMISYSVSDLYPGNETELYYVFYL